MQQSSASNKKTFFWAVSRALIRYSREMILIVSVVLILKSSMTIFMDKSFIMMEGRRGMGSLLTINHTDGIILPWLPLWIKENIEYVF